MSNRNLKRLSNGDASVELCHADVDLELICDDIQVRRQAWAEAGSPVRGEPIVAVRGGPWTAAKTRGMKYCDDACCKARGATAVEWCQQYGLRITFGVNLGAVVPNRSQSNAFLLASCES